MSSCGVFTGILFSRKPCGKPAAIHCGRCQMLLCKDHLRPQSSGPFLCPGCDAYEHDREWNSSSDGRWRHHTGSSSRDERVPAAAGGAAAGMGAGTRAAAGDLADEDKEGFAAGGSGTTWHSDDFADAGNAEVSADGDSDFDAS